MTGTARRVVVPLFLTLTTALASAAPAAALRGDTTLVSRATGSNGAKGNAGSAPPSISADGRFVAFYSLATNLANDDRDPVEDVFVRKVSTRKTMLVSRASGAQGTKGNRGSFDPALSANGRFVAFDSEADNLSPDDADAVLDVFVRDLVTGETTLISRADGPSGAKANGNSYLNAVSADGRFVVFESEGSNLHGADDDALRDVFVRDRAKAETVLVSRANGAHGPKAKGKSYSGSVSGDGRLVAFESKAPNLAAAADDEQSQVYLRDLARGDTTLISRASGEEGAAANRGSYRASVSADGRFVAFSSFASNLARDDPDIVEDVFVRDIAAAETTLASTAGHEGPKGDGGATRPSLSADGRFVAFDSYASNLSIDDGDRGTDVFVRDRTAAETTLVSRANGVDGPKANLASLTPSVTEDGRFVAFASFARNLAHDDRDTLGDVYLRDVRGPAPRCAEITREQRGSEGADTLTGAAEAELMFGLGGNDRLSGLDGGDCLYGGSGDDALDGGARGDDLRGGPGNDVLEGGAGNDQLYGDPGVNRYRAGRGDDSVFASNGRAERVDCGAGHDDARADRSDRVRGCEEVVRVRR